MDKDKNLKLQELLSKAEPSEIGDLLKEMFNLFGGLSK